MAPRRHKMLKRECLKDSDFLCFSKLSAEVVPGASSISTPISGFDGKELAPKWLVGDPLNENQGDQVPILLHNSGVSYALKASAICVQMALKRSAPPQ